MDSGAFQNVRIERAKEGKDLAGANILLLDRDLPHARGVSRVLRAATLRVELRGSLADISDQFKWDVLIVNYDSLSLEEHEHLISMFSSLRDSGRILIYSSTLTQQTLMFLLEKLGVKHILARNGEVDGEELLVTVQKILRKDIFGLEKYFPWGSRSSEMVIRGSSEKEEIMDRVGGFINGLGIQPRLANLFCIVADELISNALYNAPVDAKGEHRYKDQPRLIDVVLKEHEQANVRLCFDGRRLGLSVTDPFGSLLSEKVTGYLVRCLRMGEDQLSSQRGGTGIGLYQTFSLLSHMILNLSLGRRTEVIGLLDIRGTLKDFASRGRSFNIFVEE
jgi:hypothetical protein